ncbi:MAG: hypothetical protein PHD01_13080 [Geobacteraceae bacterium]|nr:hypothetical protein [Geobacteraceae bacterium]
MSEENNLKEQAGKAPENTEKEQGIRKSPDPTIFLVALLTILVLSISYFFVFALPKMKRDQLGLEKAKYDQEKELQESYVKCVDAAEDEYESYIKLNGRPVEKQPGAYSAPEYIWQTADRNRNAALDQCTRHFRH